MHIDSGRIRNERGVDLRSALRDVVEQHGTEVRLTARQDVLLCNVEETDRGSVEELLRARKVPFPETLRPVHRLAMACPALPTCGQALGEAERVMPDLVDGLAGALEAQGLGSLALRVNVTGCPNGCARPYTAEVGIVGRTKTGYDLYVGGSVGGDRLAERVAKDVRLTDLPAAIGPLLERYRSAGAAGEGFGDFCARVGVEELSHLVPVLARRRAKKAESDAEDDE